MKSFKILFLTGFFVTFAFIATKVQGQCSISFDAEAVTAVEGTTASFPITVGNLENAGLLLLQVSANVNNADLVNSATYSNNGTPATFIPIVSNNTGFPTAATLSTLYLLNPLSGPNTVMVTLNPTASFIAAATSYAGVSQTAPGTWTTNFERQTTATEDFSISLDATTPNSWIVDQFQWNSATVAITGLGVSQSPMWGTPSTTANISAEGDYLPIGSPGLTALSYSTSANTTGYLQAVEILPVVCTATPTNTFTNTATSTATPIPTFTPTITATPTATNTATNTATITDTYTVTDIPTNTATLTATETATNTPTSTNTPQPKLVLSWNNEPPSQYYVFNQVNASGIQVVLTAHGQEPVSVSQIVFSLGGALSSTEVVNGSVGLYADNDPGAGGLYNTLDTQLSGGQNFSANGLVTFGGLADLVVNPTGAPQTLLLVFSLQAQGGETFYDTISGTSITAVGANTLTPALVFGTLINGNTHTVVGPTATATNTPTVTDTPMNTATITTTFTATNTPTLTATYTPTNTLTLTATLTPTPPILAVAAMTGTPSGSTQIPGATNVPALQFSVTDPSPDNVNLNSIVVAVATPFGGSASSITATLWNGTTVLSSSNNWTGNEVTLSFDGLVTGSSGSVTYLVTFSFADSTGAGAYTGELLSLQGTDANSGQTVTATGLPVVGAVIIVQTATDTATSTFTNTVTNTATPTDTPTATPTATMPAIALSTITGTPPPSMQLSGARNVPVLLFNLANTSQEQEQLNSLAFSFANYGSGTSPTGVFSVKLWQDNGSGNVTGDTLLGTQTFSVSGTVTMAGAPLTVLNAGTSAYYLVTYSFTDTAGVGDYGVSLTGVNGAGVTSLQQVQVTGQALPLLGAEISILGTATPTATNTATNTATDTPTDTPTDTATNTATDTATNTATPTPTNTSTDTATLTFTNTATSTFTNTATNTATPTATVTVTSTATMPAIALSTITGTPPPSMQLSGARNVPVLLFNLANTSQEQEQLNSLAFSFANYGSGTSPTGVFSVKLWQDNGSGNVTGDTLLGTQTFSVSGTVTMAGAPLTVLNAGTSAYYLVTYSFTDTAGVGDYGVSLTGVNGAGVTSLQQVQVTGQALPLLGAEISILGTATPTATNTATNTATDTPTDTPTDTATNTATDTATNTATPTPTNTSTDTATLTFTNTATSTFTTK